MTAKEKASELVEKYYSIPHHYGFEKKCALVAVNEIIDQWEYIDTYLADFGGGFSPSLKYWYEVKKKLEII